MSTFLNRQLGNEFLQFLLCNPVSLPNQEIGSGVGSGFSVAVLGSCPFFVRLQFSVTVLKKLHRNTPFGEADAKHKAKPLLEFNWYKSSLLSACFFKSAQHNVATVAIWCINSGHLSVPTVVIST